MATATGNAALVDEPTTHRRDAWWVYPTLVVIAYSAFIIYATFRVLEPTLATFWATGAFEPLAASAQFPSYASYYLADNGVYHYASPFGTPDFTMLVPAFLYSLHPFVASVVRTPAALILLFPAGFRFTCYYYRKSYYRGFAARPAACAVPAAKGIDYQGERKLLVLQNIHRWFLYAAIIITAFLAYDAIRSILTPNGLYFGLGSALMVVNVGFLMAYTFGCHSFRHLVGGKLDCFSCDGVSSARYSLWTKVTVLNGRHAVWAWLSLLTVAGTDVYIRYVVMSDPLGIAAALTHLGVPL